MGNDKRIDIMVDIETLSNKTDATIFQIGAVAFNLVSGDTIREFNRTSDISKNETKVNVSGSTLQWWLKKDKALFEKLLTSGVGSSEDMIRDFRDWIVEIQDEYGFKNVYLWGNGILFDNKIIQYNMETLGLEYPIFYRNDLDVRTVYQLASIKLGVTVNDLIEKHKLDGLTLHDAIDDVVQQIHITRKCLEELNIV